MATNVPSEQTVCVKSVPKSRLALTMKAIESRETKPKLGTRYTEDKDPSYAGKYLIFANYSSARDAKKACDDLQQWVCDEFPGKDAVKIMLKSDMQAPYFAVYVAGTPPGCSKEELEGLFSSFGSLRGSRRNDDYSFFINYATYESAASALEAARKRELRLGSSVLIVNAARHTMFVKELLQTMSNKQQYSFSLEDAKRVGETMDQWAPEPQPGIEALLKATPHLFVLDRKAKQFHIIDPSARLAPTTSLMPITTSARPSSPEPATKEEARAMKARLSAIQDLVHDNFDLLHKLFVHTWYEAKGSAWIDSQYGFASCSAIELKDELLLESVPDTMLKPIQDWDLTTLTWALTAKSLKAKLQATTRNASPRGEDERFEVLVRERVISREDLVGKFNASFFAARSNAAAAVQTLRFVRNLLSHRAGSSKGLSRPSFLCLDDLISEALRTLAGVLGARHLADFESTRELILSALSRVDEAIASSTPHTSSLSVASSSSDDDDITSVSSRSSTTTQSTEESQVHKVEDWSVQDVLAFFERFSFPTAGVEQGQVDGKTLLFLFNDEHNALTSFTDPVPDGMGFSKLLFLGKFKMELRQALSKS
jgi:hypothetical protein